MSTGSAAVVVALALILLDAPVPARCLIALPVLVLVPGRTAVRLLLGRSAAATGRGDDDSVLRAALAIVLGTLFLLASALVVGALGLRIDTVSVAFATAVGSLLLLAVAAWRLGGAPESVPGAAVGSDDRISMLRAAPGLRRMLGVLLGVAVLVGALAGARALQTPPVEKYDAVTFDDPRMLQADPLTAGPGTDVLLPWTLRSFGRSLDGVDVSASVTVGAVAAADSRPRVDPVRAGDGDGATAALSGSVTFSAPENPGLYQVDLTVLCDGVSYLLETHLEVQR